MISSLNKVKTQYKIRFIAVILLPVVHGWVNSYDQPVNFQCPDTHTISTWRSQHDNGPEDRVFDFQCSYLEHTAYLQISCSWSGYVNNWDEDINFSCPKNGYINGFHSVHHNVHEDRRMEFRCCTLPDMCVYNCHHSGYINNWDAPVHYSVPIARMLHGVISYHHNQHEDRRWGFTNCLMKRCSTFS